MRISARHLGMATLVASCLLATGAAVAQDARPAEDPCSGFAWPLQREQVWLSAAGLQRVAPGDTLPPDMPAAVLSLKRYDPSDLPHAASREPKPGTYAGAITMTPPITTGLVQVTLSDEGWIDLFQDGVARNPVAHTGRKGCPWLRKSLRFQLASGPIVIQITDARAETLRIAVAPADDTP